MRHDYPHAETQRAQRFRRDFIVPLARSAPHPSKGRGPWQGGRGDNNTDPTLVSLNPSPTMGGELITTSACNYAPVTIVYNLALPSSSSLDKVYTSITLFSLVRRFCEICEICVRLKLLFCVK